MIIIGAGLSGLIAATLIPGSRIVESGPEHQLNHKALLRFRDKALSDALGIEFRKVTVRKGIYFEGKFVEPNIFLANMYSQKVLGRIADRSIWNLETVTRYIAPEDLVQTLSKRLSGRVYWETPYDQARDNPSFSPVISTAPMPTNLAICGIGFEREIFNYASIVVKRWRVPNCDVHQTIYFPSSDHSLYRASITGNLMIAEYASGHQLNNEDCAFQIEEAFGLPFGSMQTVDTNQQRFGKIAAIDNSMRRRAIRHMTEKHKLYSLGRFATWRNILLDDVLNDVYVIKKLLNSDGYDLARIGS